MGETLYYEMSKDRLGLMKFYIDDNGKEGSYHVHSNEMTRLEIWIHSILV